MTDPQDLAALVAQATPGPWEWAAIYAHDVHHLVHWVPGETFPNGDPRYVQVHSDGSAGGEHGPDIDVTGPDARLIAMAPDLARTVLEQQAEIARLTARAKKAEAALSESQAAEEALKSARDMLGNKWAESQALLATWPEVAAQWLISAGIAGDAPDDPLACAIRALTPADAQADLDARDKAKHEEGRIAGLREAVEMLQSAVDDWRSNGCDHEAKKIEDEISTILAKIKEAE